MDERHRRLSGRQSRDGRAFKQPLIGCHQGQVIKEGGSRQEAIRWILMREVNRTALNGYLVGERGLVEGDGLQDLAHPGGGIGLEDHTAPFGEDQHLPDDNRREP